MLATTSSLDIGAVLFDVLVVLFAAKAAAELAERLRIPTVLGEIVAGILVGPSVLGLVDRTDSLAVLAELGVLLLLLGVGMEMDVGELIKVGRSSMLVAVGGVVVPFAVGAAAAMALGQSTTTAVFIGAALTATSVGITARVFGDLGALGTSEARVVLGAAVVDDVLGLIILTVVAKLATGGGFSVVSVAGTTGLAVAFLLVTGVVGRRVVPLLLGGVARRARGSGTLVAVALAMALGFATLADLAHLAPIIGAFMAGLAMSGSQVAHRVERELAPVGHVFIPAFFLQIGIEADLKAMISPTALGLAAVLSVLAIIGKVVAGRLASGAGDRLLIGIGMIPRGEVGLIFAGLGLKSGVLDNDRYGALILVVLITTIITPPLLRWRTNAASVPSIDEPLAEEFLELAIAAARRAAIDSSATEPTVGFEHSMLSRRSLPLTWTPAASTGFVELLKSGTARSWRLLEGAGVIERALPEAGVAIERRRRDVSILEPAGALGWPTLDRLRERVDPRAADQTLAGRFMALNCPNAVIVAAWLIDVAGSADGRVDVANRVLDRLELEEGLAAEARFLVGYVSTLPAAARRISMLREADVLELADHIGSIDRLRALYLLTVAGGDMTVSARAAVEHVYATVWDALTHPELSGAGPANLAATRLAEAMTMTTDVEVRARLAHAPRALLLSESASDLVGQARLIEPLGRPGAVRAAVTPDGRPDRWRLDVTTRDRGGMLARVSAAIAAQGFDIESASVATWPDGAVLDSFIVASATRPTAKELAEAIEHALVGPLPARPVVEVDVEFDDDALPWCTACRVTGRDSRGLLSVMAAVFSEAHVQVHAARIATVDGSIDDLFSLTDRRGRKLDQATRARVVALLAAGSGRSRRLRRVTHPVDRS